MADPDPVVELIDADIPRAQVVAYTPVVEKVQWRIDRSAYWAVGAFAGTGKTDLLCTAAGLQRPMRGHHLLFGKDTARMHEDELVARRLKIGMVFSSGRLFNGLTVLENIALPLRYHGEGAKEEIAHRAHEALARTGLLEWELKLPSQIPRNQHQRIALARALALEPEVLLLDNPLMGVDARLARWWLDFLCALNREKSIAIVVATDDLRPWSEQAREFAILKESRFVPIGGREQLRGSDEPLVRELLMQAYALD